MESSTPDVSPSAPAVGSVAPAPAPVPAATPAPAAPSLSAVKDNIADIKEKAMDVISSSTSSRSSMIITSLFIGAGIAFFFAYVLYWILTSGGKFKKQSFTVKATKTPVTGYDVHRVAADGIPSVTKRMSLSFWLYVNEFSDVIKTNSSVFRHVWHRGDVKSSAKLSSPLVMLESNKNANGLQTNKLHITFRSSDTENPLDKVSVPNTKELQYMVATRGITINYIPIKRWVHVSVVVNKESKNMRAYLDGEMVASIEGNATTTIDGISGTISRKVDLLDLNGTGDIYIGGKASSEAGLGFSGLVSNIKYMNYDMASYEVYAEYKRGPVDNLLTKMGLPAYGLRPPVYKMGSE